MARTQLDLIAAILAKASGRSPEVVLLELKAVLVPRMKDTTGLDEAISDAEFARLLAIEDQKGAGVLKQMADIVAKGRLPHENN